MYVLRVSKLGVVCLLVACAPKTFVESDPSPPILIDNLAHRLPHARAPAEDLLHSGKHWRFEEFHLLHHFVAQEFGHDLLVQTRKGHESLHWLDKLRHLRFEIFQLELDGLQVLHDVCVFGQHHDRVQRLGEVLATFKHDHNLFRPLCVPCSLSPRLGKFHQASFKALSCLFGLL